MSKKMPSLKTPNDVALYCTLRRALRKAPDFIGGYDCIVLLNVPSDRCAEDYDTCAASLMLRLSANRDDMAYVMITAADKPRAIVKRLEADHKKRRLLIFKEQAVDLPLQVSLSIDVEVDLAPISVMDFRIGCRIAYQIDATATEAEAAMKYPLDHVWAALRRGRPIKGALARLAKASELSSSGSKSKGELPLLEAMYGFGAAKTWGLELAQDLKDWQRGTIDWSEVDTGIVLSGPPGVGKTQFAAALARQCGIPIIAASLARWQANGHLGDLLKAMRTDFAKAKDSAPSILFVDELDSFGDRNSFTHDHKDYSVQVVNAFLEHLDGLDGREGVVMIGATNDLSRIDPAILRPGRLDRHVAIPLPTATDRIAILQQQLGQELPSKHHSRLAAATSGFSGADLAKVARDAKRVARRARRHVTMDDVVEVLPELVPITGKLRRALAVHEAGHAAAVVVLDHGKFHGAMIIDHTRNDAETVPGGGAYYELPNVAHRTAQTYRNQIAVLLAGMAAEEVFLGAISDGSGAGERSDLAQATRIATLLQTGLGMGNRLRHSLAKKDADLEKLRNTDATITAWVDGVLQCEFGRAKQLIWENRQLVERIADELESRGKVTADQVAEMVAKPDLLTRRESRLHANNRTS
ncbi:AAA family ATPase [Neorhizobium galegae]|uniref:Putative ATP-dependent hydrolase protein n=1 Tax=Neorhizobium galegae bv. orientalis str. HAMBI 540 TaxID=1028800 RepID=A0A068SKF3_NEOGA|nr:AAA family ATPase [Neorhizobium galegae]CDN46568.1 Putative ATP-dependent hydrolase protein [Neorhizobium galegae bv. orientalis str. HAMBI 540]